MATRKKSWLWPVKKYCRWYRLYRRRVKAVEREIGGEIMPC